jgi:carboxylate-amine ligase
VERARTIVAEGTSAERQIARYQQSIGEGASNEEALKDVVDQLIEETTPQR